MSKGDPARPEIDPRLRQPASFPRWQPRRKRATRRLRNDLRNALPMLGLILCFGLSAGAIFAAEWLPAQRGTSLPHVSAARPERAECQPRNGVKGSGTTCRIAAALTQTP